MGQRTLRQKLVRLAAGNPELRPKILPLLQKVGIGPVKRVRLGMRFSRIREQAKEDGGRKVAGQMEIVIPNGHTHKRKFQGEITAENGLGELTLKPPAKAEDYGFWLDVFIELYWGS